VRSPPFLLEDVTGGVALPARSLQRYDDVLHWDSELGMRVR